MARTESKAIVISSGNIPPFHIFLLPSKCYIVPDTRPRFHLLFEGLSHLSDLLRRHVEYQLNIIWDYLIPFFKLFLAEIG